MSNPRQITRYLTNTRQNLDWLEKEKARIESHGKACEVVKDPFNSQSALFYKYGYYKDGEWKGL
jgi:hypothetical protein